jgi:hypothetical protein
MAYRHLAWLAVSANVILLAACSDKTTSESAGDTSTPDHIDYVLLLDDDDEPDQVQGEPNAYALTARGAGTPPLAVLDVPAGYSNFGSFALVPETFPEDQVPLRTVQYWTVDGVFVDPCAMDEGAPGAGETVEDMAGALAALQRTTVSEPVPVSLDSQQGLYLELTASEDIAFENCDLGYFGYWEGSPDDAQHTVESPGTVDRIWILDVDGERVVLVATVPPGVTEAHACEVTDMVESARFVES